MYASHINWSSTALNILRNNIFEDDVQNGVQNITNSVLAAANPLFVGSGGGGLNYRIQSGSPARNAGVVLAGYTDGYEGVAPDIGAYEYNDTWTAGYSETTPDDLVYLENDNSTFTSYFSTPGVPLTPTTFSNSAFSGGTASYFNTIDGFITVNFEGTAFEWFAEKYNHGARVEVKVDGVTQDCDAGTGGTQNCDLYINAAVNNSTLIFTKTGLSAGAHTVQLKIIDKNASSSGYFLNHDSIKITP